MHQEGLQISCLFVVDCNSLFAPVVSLCHLFSDCVGVSLERVEGHVYGCSLSTAFVSDGLYVGRIHSPENVEAGF
jgi:hypothetical protein